MKLRYLNLAKSLGVASLLMGSGMASAETLNIPATVAVNNAIDFTSTGTLDFGVLRATASHVANDCRIITMPANPASALAAVATYPTGTSSDYNTICTVSGTSITAALQSVSGTPTRPVFTLAGLAPFSNMTLTLPSGAGNIVPLVGALPPGSAGFTIGDFTAYKTSAPAATIALASGVGTVQADASGGAVFTVGASIATDATVFTGANYQDGTPYTGAFDVTVTY